MNTPGALPEVADSVDPWQPEGLRLSAEARRRRRLTPDDDDGPKDTSESGERLTPRLTIPQVVQAYESAVADIRRGYELVAAAEERLNAVFKLDDWRGIHVDSRNVNYSDADVAVAELRKQVWDALIDRLEIRRMMSIRAAAELDEQLKKGELPEITPESVAQIAHGFASNLDKMLEDAIEEVFDWLRPRMSRYKTNSELEVPPRVVLSWMVDAAWSGGGFRVNYHREQHLRALENVFTALDGKGSITKTHHSRIADAIGACGSAGKGETEYFKFRCFKNRNMHLEFRRADLLRKFNAIAGGRRLRPGKDES